MPAALSPALRQHIWRAHQQGQPTAQIARHLGVSARTVRHLLQQQRQAAQPVLWPRYAGCGRPEAAAHARLRQTTCALRQEHPHWGAGRLRVELRCLYPRQPLPSVRTLQRWLHALDQPAAPPGRPPSYASGRATQPHQVWQIDAVEQLPLASGQQVCWLRVVDECSGAVLQTTVFPPGPLQSGAGRASAAAVAGLLCPLGRAGGRAGGQRLAVGFVE